MHSVPTCKHITCAAAVVRWVQTLGPGAWGSIQVRGIVLTSYKSAYQEDSWFKGGGIVGWMAICFRWLYLVDAVAAGPHEATNTAYLAINRDLIAAWYDLFAISL